MNVGIIKSGVCINTCLFADLQTAQAFLAAGVWPDADSVTELPNGYGIGDSYDGISWTKAPIPEPPVTPIAPLSDAEELILDHEERIIVLEVIGGI